MSWTPYDLPHLVARTADTTTQSLAKVQDAAAALTALEGPDTYQQVAQAFQITLNITEEAQLYWMDRPVTDMIAGTADTVPTWTPAEAMPAPVGVVAFNYPPTQLALEPGGEPHDVDALAWHALPGGVWVEAWTRKAIPGKYFASGPLSEIFHARIPEHLPTGAGIEVPAPAEEPTELEVAPADAYRFLSILGATWLLMGQPGVMEEPEPVAVPRVRRRTGRLAGQRRPVRVSVHHLSAPEGGREPGGVRRPAQTRWWVRGHWRQQAYGPGWSLRKPVFIRPHLAGAQDQEPDPRPSVQIWRE